MSEHLFAWRTTTTARLTDDAEAMGNDLDPVLCTVGPATAHRRPHAIPLLGRLFPTDLPSPAGPTFRLSATELLPFRERVQDGIGMPGAMAAVARPGILARVGHHCGPHRVGLDVPQNDEQVVAVLDDRGSAAALPDVAASSLSPVVPPGVSDGQGLEDAARTRDAWLLDPEDTFVVCLCREGEPQPFRIMDAPDTFAIEGPHAPKMACLLRS